jgi:hypothetical protein
MPDLIEVVGAPPVTIQVGPTPADVIEIVEPAPAVVEVIQPAAGIVEVVQARVDVIEVVERGQQGPPGIPGRDGAGAIAVEAHVAAPAGTWILPVPDGFGRRPEVAVYLETGEQVFADVVASPTLVTVTFPTPTAGYAVLT